MDGFKNSTKMKYMCGGPVRKATGGIMKSAAPKSVAKSAAAGKQLPTPEIAPKPRLGRMPEPVREAPRPTMEPKRQVQPTPPKDVKTIGGAPKSAKTMGGEPKRSDEGISAKRLLAGSAGDYAAPPEKAKTIGGAPKGAKTPEYMDRYAKTVGVGPKTPPKDAKTMGGVPKGVKTGAAAAQTMGGASRDAKTMGSVSPGAKTMGSVSPAAKRGVPVASNKPMIGQFKTGGYVSKSTFKW